MKTSLYFLEGKLILHVTFSKAKNISNISLYANNYLYFDLVTLKTVNKSFTHHNVSIFRIIKVSEHVKSLQIIQYQFHSETSIYLLDISMGSSREYKIVECFLIPNNYNFDTLLEKNYLFKTKRLKIYGNKIVEQTCLEFQSVKTQMD